MEKEEPHALEVGKEEAQTAQEKDEEARRRALKSSFSLKNLFLNYLPH